MTRIKAIIFDMDGVLIDATEWHYEALNKALDLFGLSISRYEHLSSYDGLPTTRKLEMLSIEKGLPKQLHNFINLIKQQYTVDIINKKCKPTFIHEYALSKLKKEGYKLALASNSIAETIKLMMRKSCLDKYLEFCLSNQDVKLSKPNPEIYLKAIHKLNLNPKECLILEDNDHGKKAAIDSGAWLLEIENIWDVNYQNIYDRIRTIEGHQ